MNVAGNVVGVGGFSNTIAGNEANLIQERLQDDTTVLTSKNKEEFSKQLHNGMKQVAFQVGVRQAASLHMQ